MTKEQLSKEFLSLFFCSNYISFNDVAEKILDFNSNMFSLKNRSADDIVNDISLITNHFMNVYINNIVVNIYPLNDYDDYV